MTDQSTDLDVRRKSVTAGDYNTSPEQGVWTIMLEGAPGSGDVDLPAFCSHSRDWILYSTLYRESMWAAALSIAVTKLVSQEYDVTGAVPDFRIREAKRLFTGLDGGRGWIGGLSRHLYSYALTGNGGPVEIVHATSGYGSKILGLVPLDPFRCTRTGDPQYPAVYRDKRGRQHVMRAHQLFWLSDSPDIMDTWYGVGHCAAERAYKAILKLEAIDRYVY